MSGCRQSDHPLTHWHHCPRSPPSSSQRAHAATLATIDPTPTIPTRPSQDSPSLELGIENQDQVTHAAVHAWLTSLCVGAAYAAILPRTVPDLALIDGAKPVGGLRTGFVVALYATASRKPQDPARAPHSASGGNPPPRAEIIFCRWVVGLAGGIGNQPILPMTRDGATKALLARGARAAKAHSKVLAILDDMKWLYSGLWA